MKDKIKVLKTYRDCTGKNAIYLIKKTKPNEKIFFSLVLRSVCTDFSNGKLSGTSAIHEISLGGSVQLPSSVIYIGESAFENTIISQIILNDKIVKIEKSAFSSSYIKRLDLPDSVIQLGE